MYWADKLAEEIIRRNPDKEEYVCAAGISPSGSIHIGNFRDIATSYFVVKALRKKGKKAKLLFSWDNFDRFRKVPVNVAAVVGNRAYDRYVGMPYVDIPDPFGQEKNYAEYFQKEFLNSFRAFGIEMSFRSQADVYRSGAYAERIIFALRHRKEIFTVLDRHRTQNSTEEERENYYPVNIYCPHCNKDTTKVVSLSEDCTKARFVCECGYEGEFDFTKDFNCKLPWKVDWPMRWQFEGVDFEPGGKDHASKNGSYDTAKDVAKSVFGYRAPLFQGYEFIGIKGNVNVGKMSGSSGLNMTPEFLLKLYQPEVILWLYSKTEPLKAFDFCMSDEILRQYFEFDKCYTAYRNGTANEAVARVMENCVIEGRTIEPVPMAQLVELGSVVDFNADLMEALFAKIGTPYEKAKFAERFAIAKFWLKTCAPENEYIINSKRNWPYYRTLNENERTEIRMLHDYIAQGGYTLDSVRDELYAIPKRVFPASAENMDELKVLQSAFFKHVYNLLISRDKGPRLYLYLFAVESVRYLNLLDFSLPEEQDPDAVEEVAPETAAEIEVSAEDRYVENPETIKAQVEIEDFAKLDMRVCKVISCKAIRKANKLYKLIVHDGMKERTIVSSLAEDYAAEQLVGKKLIVLINLKPHKFANEISEGMLLASVNEDGASKILTVEDSAQIGSCVH